MHHERGQFFYILAWTDSAFEELTRLHRVKYSVSIGGSTLSSLSTFRLVSFFFLVSLAKFIRVASEFVVQPWHPDTVFQLCTLSALASTFLP